MADKPPFYITTAIFYPNGNPHIGHAYEAIASDVIARYKRLAGYDVFFLSGTDEHGKKMLQTADDLGIPPLELADKNSSCFIDMLKVLNCSNNDFIRTTETRHHEASKAIWTKIFENGDIYLDKYSGWYSVRDEAFYDEKETRLLQDGTRIGPQDTAVEWVEEESYFFKLSAYQDRLLAFHEENPDYVGPATRRNEILSFIKGGLRDLSISRTTFDWGITVPGDEKHVMYVWLDALTNYITAVGFPDESKESWNKYWPCDLHMIGKDIIRFHAIYWPAFLISAGLEPAKRIFAHGHLFDQGEKMSKSSGNGVDPFIMADHYGIDQIRYFFMREVPFGSDGNFSHESLVQRINSDLANDLGNLAQRSLSMVAKNLDGILPQPSNYSDEDEAILGKAEALYQLVDGCMNRQELHKALVHIWDVVSEANRYFASQEPWALRKTDPDRMATVLYVTMEVIRYCVILASPFIPQSSQRFLDLLGVPSDKRDFSALSAADHLEPGTKLVKPEPVFPRYVEGEKEAIA